MVRGSCGVALVARDWSSPITSLVDITSKVSLGETNGHHHQLWNTMCLLPLCCMLSNLSLSVDDASPVVAGHVWENCQDGAQDQLCDTHDAALYTYLNAASTHSIIFVGQCALLWNGFPWRHRTQQQTAVRAKP